MRELVIDRSRYVLLTEREYQELTSGKAWSVGRKELAQMWGISVSTLSEQPWRLPDWGVNSKGRRDYKFSLSDCVELVKQDPNKLRERYKMEFGNV